MNEIHILEQFESIFQPKRTWGFKLSLVLNRWPADKTNFVWANLIETSSRH